MWETIIPVTVLIVVLCGSVWGWKVRENRRRYLEQQRVAQREHQAQLRQRRQWEAAERQRRDRNQRGRLLQLALMKLDEAPDFRRVDSWAAKCKDLPAAFRQRQYRRFRHKLVEHLATRLNAGSPTDALIPSLRSLIKHLGVSRFEAEYILQEVEESHRRRPHHSADEFATALQRRQQEHARRMDVLRSAEELSDDLREQLIEAEEMRFHQQLFGGQSQIV